MSGRINFISCVSWVKRGAPKPLPETLKLTNEDVQRVIDQTKNKLNITDDVQMDVEQENEDEDAEFNRRYGLDTYDDEQSEGEEDARQGISDLAGLTTYASNEEDPYFDRTQNEDEEDDDKENFEIKPQDNLLLIGHVETNASVLEVHVYNEDDLYIHHDVIMPAYPLCFEWLNFDPSKPEAVNYVATGDMTNEICIWDLDIVNQLEPTSKLIGHDDSVLCLSWNKLSRKVMASGSADHTVHLWDLTESKSVHKFDAFGEKVQSLAFHPVEAETLLIGDCAGGVTIADCKSMSEKKWTIKKTEIENVIWNHFMPYYFFAATESGVVCCFDARVDKKPVYTINAHEESVTGLAMSSSCPGCLVTTSSDKQLKIWDVASDKASFVAEFPKMKVGRVLSLAANPDEPFVFAVGGDAKSDNFRVIDISTTKAVEALFLPRVASKSKPGNASTSS